MPLRGGGLPGAEHPEGPPDARPDSTRVAARQGRRARQSGHVAVRDQGGDRALEPERPARAGTLSRWPTQWSTRSSGGPAPDRSPSPHSEAHAAAAVGGTTVSGRAPGLPVLPGDRFRLLPPPLQCVKGPGVSPAPLVIPLIIWRSSL